eukprot:6014268-Prymnesium_polylepis.1
MSTSRRGPASSTGDCDVPDYGENLRRDTESDGCRRHFMRRHDGGSPYPRPEHAPPARWASHPLRRRERATHHPPVERSPRSHPRGCRFGIWDLRRR